MRGRSAAESGVSYGLAGGVARIAIDDGHRNVMTSALLGQLSRAFAQAGHEARSVILTGRPGIFSAGFDLQVFARRDPAEIHAMMSAGANLALQIYECPLPVVTACTGHAFPMGAFLLLASDLRLGAKGDYQVGLNEVQLGIALPKFAVELCRARLSPSTIQRLVTGEMHSPSGAVEAGFLDQLVDNDALEEAATQAARQLADLDPTSFRVTKERIRNASAFVMKAAIEAEITIDYYTRLTGR